MKTQSGLPATQLGATMRGSYRSYTKEQWEAKQRSLLAAAPDLLAACEEEALALANPQWTRTDRAIRLANLRAAIAKAKGQS